MLESLQSQKIDKPAVRIEDINIDAGAIGHSPYESSAEGSNGNLPVIMYFHGGGWILGSKNTHDRLIRELATSVNAAVVFVNYSPIA